MGEAARILSDRLQSVFANGEQVDRDHRQAKLKISTITNSSATRRNGIRPLLPDRQGVKTHLEYHDNRHVLMPAGMHDPPSQTAEVNFICPHCGSFYEVLRRAATQHVSVGREITCSVCRGPLPTHDAEFTLGYFLWRKTDRGWHRTGLDAE